ncbi:MAG TPA: hypothetical protein VE959_30650 [Bryobacteraceae bacterium]|nr:hypothetical protein [Bryobacteraceae bacterium]
MHPPGAAQPVAGICSARDANADLPPVGMIYIHVADLDESIRRCLAPGGKLRRPAESLGAIGPFCVIEDPAGAIAALVEPPRK